MKKSIALVFIIPLLLPSLVFAQGLPCPYNWTRTLALGATGDDVLKLQQFLNTNPATSVALSGLGSSGMETQKFGALTKLAVKKFQELYAADILIPNGLSSGTGLVGPSTRIKLNNLCSGTQSESSTQTSSSSLTPPSQPMLIVGSGIQPARTLAPANALYVPFTTFTLTATGGDVTVNHVKVAQSGFAKDAAFLYLSLLDEDGVDVGDVYLHSDHTGTSPDSFVIPAGTTKTITVTGNMNIDLTDYEGQIAQFRVDAIDASAPVSGLPIAGTMQTLNSSLVVGTASTLLSAFDPNNSQTRYVTDTNIRFSAIRITAGSQEDLRLDSITWDQVGTAADSDIKNVATVIDGVSYPALADGHSYTSIFPNGIRIKKGESVDALVTGDATPTGAGRTVRFNLRYSTDVFLTGLTYGYGIAPIPGGNTAVSGNSVFITDTGDTDGVSGDPYFSGSVATISAGVLQSVGR